MGIYFIFEAKFSWNEGVNTCFNVECVLLGRNFGFLGGYLVVTSGYCSLSLISTFSMNKDAMSFDKITIGSVKRNINRIRCCGISKCEPVNLMKKVNLDKNRKYII